LDTPTQTAGAGWRVVAHPDDLQTHENKWRAAVANYEPHESEVRFRRADGQYRWHLDRGHPLRDEEGNIIRWYGIVTDIEDRKRVEEALRRNEHFLAEAQRHSHTGSFGWQTDNGEIVWSDDTYRIFEYDLTEKPTLDMVTRRVDPRDRQCALISADVPLAYTEQDLSIKITGGMLQEFQGCKRIVALEDRL
jgi:PAS domain-containing protein